MKQQTQNNNPGKDSMPKVSRSEDQMRNEGNVVSPGSTDRGDLGKNKSDKANWDKTTPQPGVQGANDHEQKTSNAGNGQNDQHRTGGTTAQTNTANKH